MEHEALSLETLAIAQAARNSGGIVVVQVERMTERHAAPARDVRLPGILVDAVVVASPENHPQTFAEAYNPSYTGECRAGAQRPGDLAPGPRRVIAERAARELRPGTVVNVGIGVPEGVVSIARERGLLEGLTLTIEPGGIGGIPAVGLSFGAAADPAAIVDQPSQFDFYDGGGLDQAFLGLAEVDRHGNVNVSRFGSRLVGAGGFINISQNARAVHFVGTFANRATVEIDDGAARVVSAGTPKFVADVRQVTFSGRHARAAGRSVSYITERCVLRLEHDGLVLTEIAPGSHPERDVIAADGLPPADREGPARHGRRPVRAPAGTQSST